MCEAFDANSPPNPLPSWANTKALWDTGAHTLQLVPVGQATFKHAGGSGQSPTYMVQFKLPNNVGVNGALVTEFAKELQGGGFDVILGMDVITVGDFSITNVGGQTWMSFRTPSLVPVDFVAEHTRLLFAGVGRNDPCPCGGGKKFKKCHGA